MSSKKQTHQKGIEAEEVGEKVGFDGHQKKIVHEEENILSSGAFHLKVYKTRWLMLLIYCMSTMLNGSMFMGLSSVSGVVAPYYNVSTVHIEWLSNMFMIVYIFVAMPSAYFMSKRGVRAVLTIASGFGAAAASLQYAGTKRGSYQFVVIGQFFAAIAYGNIIQVPGKLSAVWFAPHERGISTSIGVFMNILGVAVGFVQPAHVIPNTKNYKRLESGLRIFFLSKVIIAFLIFGLTALFYTERPPTPSSHSTMEGEDELGFGESLKILIKDKHFVLMAHAYGIYYGLYVGVSVVVSPLVLWKYEYLSAAITQQIGWMGFTCNIAAAVSCFLIGLYLGRTSNYKGVAVFLNGGSMLLWLSFIMILTKTTSFEALFTIYVAFGAVGIPYFASGVEQAAEMTAPVPEGTSSAVILQLGNLYGFMFILGFGELLERNYQSVTLYVILGLYGLSTLCLCIAKTELKRSNAEAYSDEGSIQTDKVKLYGTNKDEKWTYIVYSEKDQFKSCKV